MNLLSILALIMLVLVGYAAGITAVSRRKAIAPTLWDLLLVAVIWTAAFVLRPRLGHWWSVLVWLLVAGIIGATVTALRHRATPDIRTRPTPHEGNLFRRGWERWKLFAADMGNVQGRLLMGFFYFIVVTPFGLIFKAADDSLRLRRPDGGTAWQARDLTQPTLEEGRRQG